MKVETEHSQGTRSPRIDAAQRERSMNIKGVTEKVDQSIVPEFTTASEQDEEQQPNPGTSVELSFDQEARQPDLTKTSPTGEADSTSKGHSSGVSTPMSDLPQKRCQLSKVTASRIIFSVTLAVVAAVLGYCAYFLLTRDERRLAIEQYEAIADRALQTSAEISVRNRLGVISLARIAEETFPNAKDWPNVYIKGFDSIAKTVMATASTPRDMGLMPLVQPDELQLYENFCYDVVFNQSGYPNTTGVSPGLGKVVYGLNVTVKDPKNMRYRVSDLGGKTMWGSPYNFSFPYLYHSQGASIILMGDMHSTKARGEQIDMMYKCSLERATRSDSHPDEELMECGIVTDIVTLNAGTRVEVRNGPGAVLFQPIYPANDKTTLTGLISSTIVWDQALKNVFSAEVSGVDCILRTQSQVYTYSISEGQAILVGEGDFHDPSFEDYVMTSDLHPPGLYSNFSAHYTLTLYPNPQFFATFSTFNPMIGLVGAVGIIILTSILFFLYDYFVQRELGSKDAIAKAKRQFVRFISHEVRTPLNAVCMGLQLLRDEICRFADSERDPTKRDASLRDDDRLLEKLADWSDLGQDILTNSQKAVDVLNDMLNYDKVESKTLHLELSIVNIWSLIESVTKEFTLQAKSCQIDCTLKLGNGDFPELPVDASNASELPPEIRDLRVVGDSARLAQTLRNLISNALKFTPEGGNITVSVGSSYSTKSRRDDMILHGGEKVSLDSPGTISVAVTDTGAGMTKDQLANVFSEGVQFDVNKLQAGKGSGLGLYISKGILDQHGGSLTVASRGLGTGTTFTMTLPLYEVHSTSTELEQGESFSEGEPGPSKIKRGPSCSLRVLVVDDSAMNRKLLVRLLQNQGHICVEAEDGTYAVERIKESLSENDHFHSILMDYEMPEMNGPEATKAIREMGCDSFIVGVTGALFQEQVDYFTECGANRVLPKPLRLQALLDIWTEYEILG